MTGSIAEIVSIVLAALGVGFQLVAGLGVARMPDLLTRMHASSKAATLGCALVMLAVGIRFGEAAIAVRVGLIIGFLFLTAPVAAQMIGRAGYRGSRPLSDENVIDEYRPTVRRREREDGGS